MQGLPSVIPAGWESHRQQTSSQSSPLLARLLQRTISQGKKRPHWYLRQRGTMGQDTASTS